MSRHFLTTILILATTISVYSQVDTLKYKKTFWFDLGLGLGRKGLALNTDFNFEVKQNWIMTLRIDGIDETDNTNAQSCPDKINSNGVSLLVGRLIKRKHGLFLINIGPSVIDLHHNPCTKILSDQYHEVSLGINISSKAFFTSKYFGAGINPFININDKRSYYGLTLNIAIGRFRRNQF